MPNKSRKTPSKRRQTQNSRKVVGRQARRRAPMATAMTPTHRHAAAYAESLLHPHTAPPAGLPMFPSLPSSKRKWKVHGQVVIGTDSVGYVVLRTTFQQPTADVSANYPVVATAANFASDSIALTTDPNQGIDGYNWNQDVEDSNLDGNFANIRIVSAGIRACGTMPELDRGGTIYALHTPDHSSVDGLSLGHLTLYDDYGAFPVTRDWVGVNWSPVNEDETRYHTDKVVGDGGAPLVLLFTGKPGNTFRFEATINVELQGALVRGKTETHGDMALTHRIVSGIQSAGHVIGHLVRHPSVRHHAEQLVEFAKHQATHKMADFLKGSANKLMLGAAF